MEETVDVLVVGAGPTGLTLAAGLLRHGVRVRLVDRAERANPHSKAITLWPRALEVLGTLGVGRQAFDLGVKLTAASYYAGDRLVGRLRMRPLDGTRYPLAISLPQSTTERVLRGAVEREGGEVEFGKGLVSLAQDGDGAVATLDGGETVRASWVVGCDGAHSTVREQSGVPFEGAPYPQTFVLVDGEYDTEYEHNESYYVMTRAGVIVVVGLPDGLYRVFASVPPGQEVTDAEETVGRIVAEHSPLPLTLRKATGSGVFQIHRRMVASMRSGRFLLAGDAAHIHSPAGGLGLNTGVEDAHSLAWRLAGIVRGTTPESELDAWEAERLFVAKDVIAETDRQTQMWMLTGWQSKLRDLLIELGLGSGVLENLMPRRMAQLDLVLPSPHTGRGGLRPGLRIPDVPLGGDRYLHELLEDGGHGLLVLSAGPKRVLDELGLDGTLDPRVLRVAAVSPGAGNAGGLDVLVADDSAGLIRSALDAPREAVCLIRPDAVIAAAADPADAADVARLRELVDTVRTPAAAHA